MRSLPRIPADVVALAAATSVFAANRAPWPYWALLGALVAAAAWNRRPVHDD